MQEGPEARGGACSAQTRGSEGVKGERLVFPSHARRRLYRTFPMKRFSGCTEKTRSALTKLNKTTTNYPDCKKGE